MAVRKFSKCGTPDQVYDYHGLGPDSIVKACGRALAETALERVRLAPAALRTLQRQDQGGQSSWQELWPDPVRTSNKE